jgi:hypothetical protein
MARSIFTFSNARIGNRPTAQPSRPLRFRTSPSSDIFVIMKKKGRKNLLPAAQQQIITSFRKGEIPGPSTEPLHAYPHSSPGALIAQELAMTHAPSHGR